MLAAEGIGHKVAVESAPPMLKRARGTAKIRSFAFRVPSTEFQAQPLNGQVQHIVVHSFCTMSVTESRPLIHEANIGLSLGPDPILGFREARICL